MNIVFMIYDKGGSDKKDKDIKSKDRKENEHSAQKKDKKEGMFTCTKCEYECKKESTLEKHRITEHEDHTCKECKDKLPSFMDLMKHVAEHHCKALDSKN